MIKICYALKESFNVFWVTVFESFERLMWKHLSLSGACLHNFAQSHADLLGESAGIYKDKGKTIYTSTYIPHLLLKYIMDVKEKK